MKLEKLTNAQAGALALVVFILAAPPVLSLLFLLWGLMGRAWHWMLAGF
jgi:hypothetical protein